MFLCNIVLYSIKLYFHHQSHIFCLFILFMRFSRQEYWSSSLFSSPVDHVLSKLSTMSHQYWVVLHDMAHNFIFITIKFQSWRKILHINGFREELWGLKSYLSFLIAIRYGGDLRSNINTSYYSLCILISLI